LPAERGEDVLPGKKYQLEDLVWLAWRWKWLIAGSFVIVASTTFVVARLLPDRYRADELLEVVPQRVSQAYVRPTLTIRIEDSLSAIQQRVLSRTSLERIIQEFNLYESERRAGLMEDVVERMRTKDIEMAPTKADAFRLSYYSSNPRKAMQVAERLASLVINESLQDRSGYADSTTEFLQSQLENAKRQLTEHEQRVAAYQRAHAGSLPSERPSNLQVLQNLQMQVQATVESINRDRDRQQMIERTLGELTAESPTGAPVVAAGSPDDPASVAAGSTAAQLEAARNGLRALLLRLTPDHPDVARQKRAVSELEAKVQAEALEKPVSTIDAQRPETPEEAARQRRIGDLRTELAGLERQLKAKETNEKRLRAEITACEGRVSSTPLREVELIALTRDYDTQRRNYESLLAKYEDSKVAASLEHREIGEQFKVLDPARLPQVPNSPNRPLINILGALGGLGLGLALVALFEYLDKSVRTEGDIVLCLSLPVLALVPVLNSGADRRRTRRRKLWMSLTAGASVVVVASGAYAWKLGWLSQLIGP
jgi:polysaccharide chain length determinant protein (PEP-CTERM system associated)